MELTGLFKIFTIPALVNGFMDKGIVERESGQRNIGFWK